MWKERHEMEGVPFQMQPTFTLESLSEDAMHHLSTHVTEVGAQEGVRLEAMGHIDFETLFQKLDKMDAHI